VAARFKARIVLDSSNTEIVVSNLVQGVFVHVLLCCVLLGRYSPCGGLIPRPMSLTKMSKLFTVSEVNSESDQVRRPNP